MTTRQLFRPSACPQNRVHPRIRDNPRRCINNLEELATGSTLKVKPQVRDRFATYSVSLHLLLQRRNNRCDEDARIDRLCDVMLEPGGKRPEAVIRPSVSGYRNRG